MKAVTTLEVKLVHSTGTQRFYKLNRTINKFPRQIDLENEIDFSIPRIKDEYKEILTPILKKCKEGVDVICVSDAHTHIERLVFAGCEFMKNDTLEYMPISMVHIDGKLTMMIHVGSYDAVYGDTVYLRHIAAKNGFRLIMM